MYAPNWVLYVLKVLVTLALSDDDTLPSEITVLIVDFKLACAESKDVLAEAKFVLAEPAKLAFE